MLRENVFRLCRERKDICIRMYLKDRGLPYPYYCSYYIYSGWIVSNAALVGGVSTVMSSLQVAHPLYPNPSFILSFRLWESVSHVVYPRVF